MKKPLQLIDFSSNDYLGFCQSETIFNQTHVYLTTNNIKSNGSTGSRLLSGNHDLYGIVEKKLASIHQVPAALVFNSGYDANLGLLSCILVRHDIILYDKLTHASIRDGMQLASAKSIAFAHNDLSHLESKLKKYDTENRKHEIYVITESIFSMDGDSPDLVKMVELCQQYNARLIVDEAHALGVFHLGLLQKLNLHKKVFARVMTFGKGLGCHGAAILGSDDLIRFLVNFSRPFIYTTALSPHALATILKAYEHLLALTHHRLQDNIGYFKTSCQTLNLQTLFIDSDSAIQSCVISQNKRVKSIADQLQRNHFDVKAILSPTVAQGQERLRFCIHSFNSTNEIKGVLTLLKDILLSDPEK
ncbi:MAG: pyridoxal phosphate-dependent aminotransferase family protein [Alcanivoracaceae bacterium]|nr:pyridoxal phosphate-dependent aminotransferase family protein [Alcanivoracaceae bacterium]